MSNHVSKADSRRFRVLRGNWMPDTSEDPGDVFSQFVDDKFVDEVLFQPEETGLSRDNYPLPSSLVDVPPLVECFASFNPTQRRYTRRQALSLAAKCNRRQIKRRAPLDGMLWHMVIENIGRRERDAIILIDREGCFEDRFYRYNLRIVEPTATEVAQYGGASFVSSFTRRVTSWN